jgi:hypothetical protein
MIVDGSKFMDWGDHRYQKSGNRPMTLHSSAIMRSSDRTTRARLRNDHKVKQSKPKGGSKRLGIVHLLIMRRSAFHTGASGRQSQPPNQLLPTAASQGGCGLAGNNRQEKITESRL